MPPRQCLELLSVRLANAGAATTIVEKGVSPKGVNPKDVNIRRARLRAANSAVSLAAIAVTIQKATRRCLPSAITCLIS